MGTSDMSNMFRGTAGVDYPDLKTIPNTNFRCEDQIIYEGGLYADVETNCQVIFCWGSHKLYYTHTEDKISKIRMLFVCMKTCIYEHDI